MENLPYDKDANFNFDSKAYLQRYLDPCESLGIQVQFLECWHTFYKEHGKELDPSKSHMLEFGGGPTIWSMISAAPNFADITFCDFAEGNRAEVEIWRDKKPGFHNWRPYIEYVVQTLEGDTDSTAVDLREQEIRRKLTNIVFCDVRAAKPVGTLDSRFDIIHTNLCLEIVCEDTEALCKAFSKFHLYLKPKGYIVCLAALEGSWYLCWNGGNKKWHQLHLTSEDMEEVFYRAGFTILYTHIVYPVDTNLMSATKKWQFIVAQNDKQD